jgi:hypothetical protein
VELSRSDCEQRAGDRLAAAEFCRKQLANRIGGNINETQSAARSNLAPLADLLAAGHYYFVHPQLPCRSCFALAKVPKSNGVRQLAISPFCP